MLEARPNAHMKMKLCALGEESVGKTSLIRRYLGDFFSSEVARTVGTQLSKKTIEIADSEGDPIVVDAVVWDIMGRKGFMDVLQNSYFYNVSGVFAVLDKTRKPTLEALHGWIAAARDVAGSVPIIILANKADLKEQFEISKEEVATLAGAYDAPYYYTSAKTGKNVEDAFEKLVQSVYERVISARVKSLDSQPRHSP